MQAETQRQRDETGEVGKGPAHAPDITLVHCTWGDAWQGEAVSASLHEHVERLLVEMNDRVQAHYADRLVSLVVFGSMGRGTPRPDSDVDLLIVAEPLPAAEDIDAAAAASAWLRKEREFAFYGDIDFVPTEQYDATTADRAMHDARTVVALAEGVIHV